MRGMMANRHLARSIADLSFSEFRRQLEYKAAMCGGQVVVADCFYASSKTCSACGHKLDALPLSVCEWTCPASGAIHDRDLNAAVNLKNMAVRSTVSACGEEGSGLRRKTKTKPASTEQEVSFVPVEREMSKSDGTVALVLKEPVSPEAGESSFAISREFSSTTWTCFIPVRLRLDLARKVGAQRLMACGLPVPRVWSEGRVPVRRGLRRVQRYL